MREYISRKAILGYLNDIWLTATPTDSTPAEDKQLAICRCMGLQDAMDAVKEFPAADVVEWPRWIPVMERLPEQGKRYLVIRYDHVTDTPFIDILWHDAHDLWWNRLYKGNYNVTHWMPLPEPPKEREHEGS